MNVKAKVWRKFCVARVISSLLDWLLGSFLSPEVCDSIYHNADSRKLSDLITKLPKTQNIMVKYYCFFKECERLSPGSLVFKVKVGSTHRDQVKRSLLENFSQDCGYYFRPWDDVTHSELILRCGGSMRGSNDVDVLYSTVVISVAGLYKHIIDGTLDYIKPDSVYNRNRFRLLSILCPAFLSSKSSSHCNTSRQPYQRKNLSPESEWVLFNAAFGMLACVVLFLLGAFLEGLERTL